MEIADVLVEVRHGRRLEVGGVGGGQRQGEAVRGGKAGAGDAAEAVQGGGDGEDDEEAGLGEEDNAER